MAAPRSQPSGDGDLASVLRRTHINDDPFKIIHSEDVHNAALEEAYVYHANLREYAVGALRLHEAREAAEQIRLRAEQEEERLRVDMAKAKEECRLRDIENKARSIPKPAPRLPTPPPVQAPPVPSPPVDVAVPSSITPAPARPVPVPSQPQQAMVQAPGLFQKPSSSSSTQQRQSTVAASPVPLIPQQVGTGPIQQPRSTVVSQPNTVDGTARYQEIHISLKKLRASFQNDVFPQNREWAKRPNELRRKIRTKVGQLSTDKVHNKQVTNEVLNFLKESLSYSTHMVDPSIYMTSKPAPREGAINNGDQLPAVFIWLLGYLAKAVVSQCDKEVSVNPVAADPIGVFVATIFSHAHLLWRGESLVDILMSKFRMSCPALFGLRGNDKTEQGRARLGWKRDKTNNVWCNDEEHTARMSGIAAGYAAISLRDFSRTKIKNPWPPSKYWMTLASICNTPAEETSNTQFTVLKAIITSNESRFLAFYGTAGKAALKLALVDFPARAIRESGVNVAADSLRTVASVLEKDYNLVLDAKAGKW